MAKKLEEENRAATLEAVVSDSPQSFDFSQGKEGLSNDLAQLKAFAEKVYDGAVRLRSGIDGENDTYQFLIMTVKSDSARLKDRFFAYQKALEDGLELRTKDFEDLQEIETLYEKVRAILADEHNDVGELTASQLGRIREKKAREKEEKLRREQEAAKLTEKPAALSEPLAESEASEETLHEIRRAQYKEFLERSKDLSERKAWTALRHQSKFIVATVLILLIPICYFAYGFLSVKDRVKIDHFAYRDIFQMEGAFEQGSTFIAVVEPTWKSLYPDEKRMMINNLANRLDERFLLIQVYDEQGGIVADFKNGKTSFY